MSKTETERLAIVETKLDSLEKSVDNVNNGITDIKKAISDFKVLLEQKADKTEVDEKIGDVECRIDNYNKSSRMINVLTGIICAASASILTYLVIFFLQNK